MKISKNLSIRFIAFTFALFLVIESPFPAQADAGKKKNRSLGQLVIEPQNIKSKPSVRPKFGKHLKRVFDDYQSFKKSGVPKGKARFKAHNHSIRISDSYVAIDAIAVNDPEALKKELEGLGLKSAAVFGKVVSGLFPMSAIDKMSQSSHLNFARSAMAVNNVGAVTSQGDAAIKADIARQDFGVDGTGVTVGVLSDSYDCLAGAAADIASGDLPLGVNVLDDSACPGIDEGRAMLQIVHDAAPGASLAFNTAFLGTANFAQGIINLANANSQVIVDDVIYFAEPMFQDGIIAQAVDTVKGNGVAYFSSAGNQSRKSYEDSFRGGQEIRIGSETFEAHDFNPGSGADIFQQIRISRGGTVLLSLQWDSPAASAGGSGSPNDVDIYLTDDPPTRVLASSTDSNIGLDPVEVLSYQNKGRSKNFNLLIVNAGGANPGKIKYVRFGNAAINEYDTQSSTSYGHANAVGAEAVGAAYWQDTPAFGTNPPQLESFSSVGGTPILFDVSGNRLPSPEIRFKPNVVGPDGGSTTFFYSSDSDGDGFPDFFGTSASAPHVAGVAALMLQANPSLQPLDIFSAMESTAVDMDDPGTSGFDTGVDFATGYGLVQADAAIASVSVPECNVHVDPLALNFGNQNVGTTQSLSVNLSNTGRADCNVTALSLTGSNDFQFASTPPATLVLTPGDSLVVNLDYTASEEGPDSGSLTINSDDPNQGTIDVSLNGSGVIVRNADLSIVKTDSADPVTEGDNITYQITVTNHGPDDATGVIMQDTLPPEVTLVFSPGCSETGQLVTCNLPDLPLGGQAILDIVVTADSAGTITNEASVSANEADPVPGNNTTAESTQVDGSPEPSLADLSIRKDADQSRSRVGSTLVYTITVTNNGPADSTGIVIVDTLPSSVSFNSASNECSSDGSSNGGVVTCSIDSIVNGSAKSVNISVTLNSKGRIENSVTVSGNEQDPDPSNNQATRRTRVR
jgi:uncharacterized repeat protein (TIGR01451 family)